MIMHILGYALGKVVKAIDPPIEVPDHGSTTLPELIHQYLHCRDMTDMPASILVADDDSGDIVTLYLCIICAPDLRELELTELENKIKFISYAESKKAACLEYAARFKTGGTSQEKVCVLTKDMEYEILNIVQ